MLIDPAIHWAGRLGISLLFAHACRHKLRDRPGFAEALAAYELIPKRGLRVVATGLIVGEGATAAAILFTPSAGFGAAVLLLLYGAAISVNLVRGRNEIDCGCGLSGTSTELSVALVARNLALAAVALAATMPAGSRPLTWIDGVTVVASITTGAVLAIAADAIAANTGRIRRFAASH